MRRTLWQIGISLWLLAVPVVAQGADISGGGSSTGTVASIDATGGVETDTGFAITSSGTIRSTITPRTVTGTTDSIVGSDRGAAIFYTNSGTVAVSLPQASITAIGFKWHTRVINAGTGTVTITPDTSTINGLTALSLATKQTAVIISDGTNYVAYVNVGTTLSESDTRQSVFSRGKVITGANSFANARRDEDGSGNGIATYTDATYGPTQVAYCNGVENDCDYVRQLNPGKKAEIRDSGNQPILTVSESNGATTNLKLDEEGTGNAITRVIEIVFPLAGCVGGSASSNLNDDATGATAPTAACNDTGSIQDPSLDFSGSAVNTAQLPKFRLPTGWTGNIDLTIRYVTVAASPTGNVEWDIATVCRGIAESWDASFNAAQTITDAVGSQNQANDATQTAVTSTGCAAGEDLTIKISRDGVNDTNNDLAKATEAIITVRATK